MQITKSLDQHIAVFGESGSGKTVLLSSFYGAAQESGFIDDSIYRLVADDIGQGNKLHSNYLEMREDDRAPMPDHFKSITYSISIRPKEIDAQNGGKIPFKALKLVWHDYPGEWFENGVSGEVEEKRRLDTFKSLLQSDVAIILVDAQRLIDHEGEEERYLKSLIGNFKNGLLTLQDDLLDNNKPLTKFPRIWIFALSKSDLLPNYNAFNFRDLMIAKVSGEIGELRNVLTGLLEGKSALSVGEDFVLLSSAKFQAGKIDPARRVGLDLVLPIATMLPFQRHLRWATTLDIPGKVGKELLDGVSIIAFFLKKHQNRLPSPMAAILNKINPAAIATISKLAGTALEDLHRHAIEKKNYLSAILSGFQMDMEKAEKEKNLIRSNR
ncbi:ATP/GTP-binding protein [Glutamicibacter ardleyensis]|uniref:ATP/GTP-binding protein n=1 Tax=Glutamicibacter ardleyensis TaxID=225894 RepID=UPI003FD6676D